VPFITDMQVQVRYQVFQLTDTRDGFKRSLLGGFRFYTDAYILLRSCQDSDPDGNYWIHDDGGMPEDC
jgi:hypothetical protein